MHAETDYHSLRDIHGSQEMTTFEHILKKCDHPGKLQMKQQTISMMHWKSPPSWTYFKEMHTVVIGNKHLLISRSPFFRDGLHADLEATVGTYELRSYDGEQSG